MHWVDAESQKILTRLVAQSAGARILLIMTFRPEYQPPSPDCDTPRRDPPRSAERDGITAAAGAAHRTWPAASMRSSRCWWRAPAAIRCSLKRSCRALPRKACCAVPAAAIGCRVPWSRSICRSRSAACCPTASTDLARPEKDVLQAASVIGPSTTLRLLERVARSPATADICARLQVAGFLEPVDAPEPTYVFHHALDERGGLCRPAASAA